MFCHFWSEIFRLRTILECKICLSCEQMLVYNQCTGTPSLAEYILTIQLNSVERAGRVRRDDQLSTNQYKHSNEGCFSKLVILEYWAINVKNKKRLLNDGSEFDIWTNCQNKDNAEWHFWWDTLYIQICDPAKGLEPSGCKMKSKICWNVSSSPPQEWYLNLENVDKMLNSASSTMYTAVYLDTWYWTL